MEYKYKLSIVIPCWNSHATIERALNSIVNNDLEKDEYQVIIVDDCSTDNFLELVKPYETKMNIVYCSTEPDTIHCPGNTRRAGIPYIEGEWFAFMDHDDEFEPNVFKKVFEIIEQENIQYVLATGIHYMDTENKVIGEAKIGVDAITWLHGKFYNTENVLNKLKINFKKDLKSHEDLYFNCYLQQKLMNIGEDIRFAIDFFTYKWIKNLKSLSNTDVSPDEKFNYIDIHLEDFLIANSEFYFDNFSELKDEQLKINYIGILITTFLYGYFYHQGSIFRNGTYYKDNIILFKDFKNKLLEICNVTEIDIINYIQSIPEDYIHLRELSYKATGPFVEAQSFRDFVLNV